jgi:ABC-type nickel/cobalt efflux system permease component RcnA
MRLLRAFLIGLFAIMPLSLAVTHVRAEIHSTANSSEGGTKIDRSRLLLGPRDSHSIPSLTTDPAGWIMGKQQQFYQSMSLAIRDIGRGNPVAASLTLIGLSFGYGVFHAAGPGHGKAVVSAWLMGNDERLRRGIVIAFMAAFIQACTAVAIVSVLLLAVGAASSMARNVASWLEALSFLLISGLGFWLIWQAVRGPVTRLVRVPANLVPVQALATVTRSHSAVVHHRHHEGWDCACGHAHLPSASAVEGSWSFRRALSISLAIGIRPCTGALLVLLFSSAAGLYWAGVISTFVMALGTAITVSVIATLAVGSRHAALALAGANSAWLDWTALTLRLGSGIVVAAVGLFLFWAALHGGVTAG